MVTLGMVTLGIVTLGIVTLGIVTLGAVTLGMMIGGTVSSGTVRFGTVPVGTVSTGVVITGMVPAGVVTPNIGSIAQRVAPISSATLVVAPISEFNAAALVSTVAWSPFFAAAAMSPSSVASSPRLAMKVLVAVDTSAGALSLPAAATAAATAFPAVAADEAMSSSEAEGSPLMAPSSVRHTSFSCVANPAPVLVSLPHAASTAARVTAAEATRRERRRAEDM